MKTITSLLGLLAAVSLCAGCASNSEEKEAYFKDGGMDQQVENFKKPGSRY